MRILVAFQSMIANKGGVCDGLPDSRISTSQPYRPRTSSQAIDHACNPSARTFTPDGWTKDGVTLSAVLAAATVARTKLKLKGSLSSSTHAPDSSNTTISRSTSGAGASRGRCDTSGQVVSSRAM